MLTFRAGCAAYADKLSAYVDSALPLADCDEVATHLGGCPGCRAEVNALRQVRALLRGGADHVDVQGNTPTTLPERLRLIAGDRADEPLWARPFDRNAESDCGYAGLPSARRTTRIRGLVGSGSLLVLVVGVVLSGWVAAPPNRQVVVEPTAGARVQFASVLNQMPLSNAAVGAVAASPGVSARLQPVGSGPTLGSAPLPSSGEDCMSLLVGAQEARAGVAVSGVQVVQNLTTQGWAVSTVGVDNLPGFGTSLSIVDGAGGNGADFVPTGKPTIVDLSSLSRFSLVCNYAAGSVAGRPAAVVEARVPGESQPCARWWLDAETGYLLWTDRFTDGRPVAGAGFTEVEVGNQIEGLGASAATVHRYGAAAPTMAGLPLLSVRGDDDDGVRSLYGDGLTTLTVTRQTGSLVPGESLSLDSTRGVWYGAAGAVMVVAWQSGDDVWTLVTDGSEDVLIEASNELPHDPPTEGGPTDRVVAGLNWIAGRIGLR